MSHETPSGQDSTPPTGQTDTTDAELRRHYGNYHDDHDADTLSDFGLELPIDETTGVLVPPETVSHIPLRLERNDTFPVEHVVLRPVGVGPSKDNLFRDVEGTESVFVNIHPVRDYDIPGHYVQAEPQPTTARIERSELEQYVRAHTIVKPMTQGSAFHWQDPENDPTGVLDDEPDD